VDRRDNVNIWAKSKGQGGHVTVLSKAPLIVLTLLGSPGWRPCYNPTAFCPANLLLRCALL